MPTTPISSLQPLASVIKIGASKPYLQGYKCSSCEEVLLESSRGCPNCAALETLEEVRLSETGKLYTYTIVHRSFPGVETPFISAIVKLDDGGFIKGNLEGIKPSPEAVEFDMPVEVRFEQINAQGSDNADLLRYVFFPI